MSLNQVYIIRTAHFLPNEPVSNDEMEEYLGLINGKPSKSRRIVLRNNGIKRRFYALTRKGKSTHTNSEMAALAVKGLFADGSADLKQVELITCGTSTPDQFLPSHASMVHGWLPDSGNAEVVSPSGACCSGMHALKYAYMAIKSGEVSTAASTGSERSSRILRSDVFDVEEQNSELLEASPITSFEKDFLRWMLSDGAGAFLLSDKKNEDGISLKIEWLEGVSFANQVETCMYMAGDKQEDGSLKSYMDYSPAEIMINSVLSMKQDVKLLSKHIVSLGFDKMKIILNKHGVKSEDINYFLPHMSSEFFRSKILENMMKNDLHIPEDRWFSNLSQVGNVGAGSIYLMVDELFKSGRLKKGEKILLAVPESARFSYVFGLLTVC
ncbi:MAG TPA: beta-ketoacyl-ACP synthase III [Bacteroidia bacterium]|nr:beta-ketoacyl-ACP synthase III [Bacteroidia bacterium]HNS11677.1 beta-ketoacyl-ACP synthase III [Bacteroidia bacterium]